MRPAPENVHYAPYTPTWFNSWLTHKGILNHIHKIYGSNITLIQTDWSLLERVGYTDDRRTKVSANG